MQIELLSLNGIIAIILSITTLIGTLDYFSGNRFRLGERFEAGLQTFPALFLCMAGIITVTPLLGKALIPLAKPLGDTVGADPALLAGVIGCCDMGGFQLAHQLAGSAEAGDFCGMLLGAIMGVNLLFTLPVALQLVDEKYHRDLFQGLVCGIITLPVGAALGGLAAGFTPLFLLHQLLPVCVIATAAALLLRFAPGLLLGLMRIFGRCVQAIGLAGVAALILCTLLRIDPQPWLAPPAESMGIIGAIVVLLPGLYVLTTLLERGLARGFDRLGAMFGMDRTAVLGLLTTLANSLPVFALARKMDQRGRIVNFAFMTAGAFTIGDHLAFCTAVAPHLVGALMVTKFSAAAAALVLALAVTRRSAR